MNQLADYRPRSAAQIVDASVRLFAAHPADLILPAAVVVVPTALLVYLLPPGVGEAVDTLSNLLMPIVQGAIAATTYGLLSGSRVTLGGAYGQTLPRAGTLIGLQIVSGLMIILGLILLIVPGLIAAARTMVVFPVAVIEDASVSGALQRSRDLTRGHTSLVFGTVVVMLLVFLAIVVGGATAFALIGSALGLDAKLMGLFTDLVVVVALPPMAIVTTMLYVDLRVRRDGLDIEIAAQAPAAV